MGFIEVLLRSAWIVGLELICSYFLLVILMWLVWVSGVSLFLDVWVCGVLAWIQGRVGREMT